MVTTMRAAFGKVRITPEEMAPLQGYDPDVFVANPQRDIVDDLYARILILESDEHRSMIISVDCCLTNEEVGRVPDPQGRAGQYREFINTFPSGTRRKWGKAADIEENCVSVHATHTHSAPAHFNERYTSRIEQKIRELIPHLVPAQFSVGIGECPIAANRRPHLKPNDDIPIDRTLHVIHIQSMEGKPLGSIVNCAVHPTMMNPVHRVSAEMVGLAMNELEEQVGNGFIAMFTQGFSGDVGPTSGGKNDSGPETYPLVKQAGHELFLSIVEASNSAKKMNAYPLVSAQRKVQLPIREDFQQKVPSVTLMAIRLGELVFLSASGEVFNGFVPKIRAASPCTYTVLSGLSNGYSGYVPTYDAFHDGLGGYEMNTTPYTAEAESIFIKECLSLLESISKYKKGE